MQTQAITVEPRLAGLIVRETREDAWSIEAAVRYEAEEVACPRCTRPTRQVQPWRRQRKQDAALWGKTMYVLLWKRRFRCRACRKVFTEDDPVCGRRRRTTRRAARMDGDASGGDDRPHRRALASGERRARAA